MLNPKPELQKIKPHRNLFHVVIGFRTLKHGFLQSCKISMETASRGRCLATPFLPLDTHDALRFTKSTLAGRKLKHVIHQRQQRILQYVRAVVVAPEKAKYEVPPFEAWSSGAPIKKRTDIKTILLLGPGPIIIGQVRPTAIHFSS